MKLKAILATTNDGIIGHEQDMPWPFSKTDLGRFKKLTGEDDLFMGRKTFDTIIQKVKKPLPKRKHWVLSTNLVHDHDQVNVIHSPKELPHELDDVTMWMIGGATIYNQYMLRGVPKQGASANFPVYTQVDEIHWSFFPGKYKGDAVVDARLEDALEDFNMINCKVCDDHIYIHLERK